MIKKQDTYYKWKIIAIIFIGLFILENIFFIWAFWEGEKDIKEEVLCLTKFCPTDKFDAYGYDIDTNICTCFNDNKIVEQHLIE